MPQCWYFLTFLITTRKRSLRRLCFYTCLSVILFTGGGYLGRSTPGPGTPPWPGTPPGRYTPGQVHPPRAVHAGRYGQQAGGTHPTEMHSCCSFFPGCDTVVKSRYKLREHLRSHTQEKVIACPTCGGLFSNFTRFTDHINRQQIAGQCKTWSTHACEKGTFFANPCAVSMNHMQM